MQGTNEMPEEGEGPRKRLAEAPQRDGKGASTTRTTQSFVKIRLRGRPTMAKLSLKSLGTLSLWNGAPCAAPAALRHVFQYVEAWGVLNVARIPGYPMQISLHLLSRARL